MILFTYKISLNKDSLCLLKELEFCGILHQNSESAATHLNEIYFNVEPWWESNLVTSALNRFKNQALASSDMTIDFLNSLIQN